MANKFNKLEYDKEYRKKHIKTISFDCSLEKDNDIIEHLSKQPNKSAYFKKLVREDIENKKIIEKIKNEKKYF